jgi:methionyl-tRNA formyltransferase
VVTQPDRPAGRGKHLQPTPVAIQAEAEGLPVEKCENVNEPAFVKKIQSLRADLGVVAAFGQLMKEPIRKAFPGQCVNLHASLLPKFRGAAPIHHAVLAGEERTGVTVFRLVDRMDAGPILLMRETRICPEETCGHWHDRLAGIACDAIDATLKLYERDPLPPGEEQEESLATRAPKISKADGHLRFDVPAEQVARRCRAMTPWPGARCRFVAMDGHATEVAFTSVSVVPGAGSTEPGLITEVLDIATSRDLLEVHGIQPAGKSEMSWQDFVNGRHVRPGDRFEPLT